jgi:hypothetical protein
MTRFAKGQRVVEPEPPRGRSGRHRRRLATCGAIIALATSLAGLGQASPAAADVPALSGWYVGPLTADYGSTANVTFGVTGPPEAITADTTLASGARIDCHGNHDVGFQRLTLTGSRTAVNGDGTSAYELAGRFEFDATVHVVVDAAVHGVLSADGHTFSGAIDLHVQPPSWLGDCWRTWSFTSSNDVRVVPDLIDETWVYARDALLAIQLNPVRSVQVDYTCNHQNTVWRLHPSAGTAVATWSTVQVVIGVRDYRRPCP